jgi:DNA-binding NarL/FixJ family response regulator
MSERDQPIRVMAVDDRLEWISTIELIVSSQPDMAYVGSARDSARALLLADSQKPHVAFVDLHLRTAGDNEGIELTKALREHHPDTAVIVLTVDDGDEAPANAIEAGAVGYIFKDNVGEPGDVSTAIREVAAGNAYFRSGDVQKLAEHLRRVREHVDPGGLLGLTPRQTEVLVLIAEGLTNQELAQKLVISEHTAKHHVAAVLKTLRVNNRNKAAKIARDSGLITRIKRAQVPDD